MDRRLRMMRVVLDVVQFAGNLGIEASTVSGDGAVAEFGAELCTDARP